MRFRACGYCEFWEPIKAPGGFCKRHAPRPFQVTFTSADPSDIPEMAHWPYLEEDDWCGEFLLDIEKQEGREP